MASTDARPVPKKNVAYRHCFAIRKNDGTLITTWAGQDSELSKDGGNFGDATNEATEIQTSGCGYIDLTSGEMNYDCVTLKVTVTNTDALPYVVNLFPEEVGDIRVNVEAINNNTIAALTLRDWLEKGTRLTADSGTTTTLTDAGLTQADDYWNGSLLIFRTGTNSGRTAIVTDFDAASNTITFAPAVPDAVTTEGFALIPGLGWANLQAISGDAQRATDLAEIAQYLIANSAEPITDYVADDSLLAKMLTADGDISAYDDQNHSLEALRVRGDAAWVTAAAGLEVDLTKIHGSALTETAGQLAGRFTDFFDQASAGYSVNTSLASFKATGFSVHNAAAVKTAIEAGGSSITLMKAVIDNLPDSGALTAIGTDTARLTAARAAVLTDWIDGGRLDLLIDAIKVVTDALTAAAAAKLALSAGTIVTGTVSHDNTVSTTTVFYCDDITEATADHFNGRIVIFTSGALQNQATDITDYALVSSEGKFTTTALTEAPADNVTFIIV